MFDTRMMPVLLGPGRSWKLAIFSLVLPGRGDVCVDRRHTARECSNTTIRALHRYALFGNERSRDDA